MKKNNTTFGIQDCRLLYVNLDINKATAPEQAEVAIELSMEHSYDDKDDVLSLIMEVNVSGKDFVMNISIKHEGLFKFNKKPQPDEHLSKTAEITCASILFPFVREAIADLTRRAGLPPLILEPMNFIDHYDKAHSNGDTPSAL